MGETGFRSSASYWREVAKLAEIPLKAERIYNKLTPFNRVMILIDFQKRLLSTINSFDSKRLIENVFNLARETNSPGIPAVLTTIGRESFGGPLRADVKGRRKIGNDG